MTENLQSDVENVSRIAAVPKILQVVCRTTGMGFAAVARVTPERWIACSVLDQIDFGLKAGGELAVETTICNEIRQVREAILINNAAEEDVWCNHATPALYGFKSYISLPITLEDGSFFGTLCAIDPRPARLSMETVETFRLFTELIATHIDANRKLIASESALTDERALGDLREQFIAVLAHDLRTPARAINCFAELLQRKTLTSGAAEMVRIIRTSGSRMTGLIDSLLDLARSRHAGLTLNRNADEALQPTLLAVVAELKATHPNRLIETVFEIKEPVDCDRDRVAQLFSNLLGNALAYGDPAAPVRIEAISYEDGFELSVANAGMPIPPAALHHLFQPFYRSALLQNRDGLGLGLYIAHEIAKAHGGTLEVRSTEEETCFTFRMPVS